MKIFICGFSGSGKSKLGKLLAKSNDFQVLDLDDEVYERMGAGFDSLGEYIEDIGIENFRKDEEDMCRLLDQNFKDNYVIILGGGALENKSLSEFISKNNSKLVYLKASFEECYERLLKDGDRPLMKKGRDFMKEKYDHRTPYFEKLADLTLDQQSVSKIESLSDLVGLLK